MKKEIFDTISRTMLDGVRLGTAQIVGDAFNKGFKRLFTKKQEEEKEKKQPRAAALKDNLFNGDNL